MPQVIRPMVSLLSAGGPDIVRAAKKWDHCSVCFCARCFLAYDSVEDSRAAAMLFHIVLQHRPFGKLHMRWGIAYVFLCRPLQMLVMLRCRKNMGPPIGA